MKLKIIHLIFVFLLFIQNIVSEEKSALQNWNYKGKVKSSREIYYKNKEKDNENLEDMKEWFNECEYIFNEKGNVFKLKLYNFNGSVESKSVNIYDSLNQIIETRRFNSEGELTNLDSFKYTMNSNGKITNFIMYNSEGCIRYQNKYFYDDLGDNIMELKYKLDTTNVNKYEYKYDVLGNLIESIWFDTNGKFVSKTIMEYDSNGNIISRKKYYISLELDNETIYEYDSYGNRIKEKLFYPEDRLISITNYSHEFDEFNNWIIEKKYIKGKLRYIIERVITYY
jgi:hypothetical protein